MNPLLLESTDYTDYLLLSVLSILFGIEPLMNGLMIIRDPAYAYGNENEPRF
jgi:hypothetical protein